MGNHYWHKLAVGSSGFSVLFLRLVTKNILAENVPVRCRYHVISKEVNTLNLCAILGILPEKYNETTNYEAFAQRLARIRME
jgi:hypothetical protein